MNEADIAKTVTSLTEAVASFAAAGTVGWIVGGVLILVIGVLGVLVWRWWVKIRVDAATQQTEADKKEDQVTAVTENHDMNTQIKTDEEKAREAAEKLKQQLGIK